MISRNWLMNRKRASRCLIASTEAPGKEAEQPAQPPLSRSEAPTWTRNVCATPQPRRIAFVGAPGYAGEARRGRAGQ